jgi:hypothetical protein
MGIPLISYFVVTGRLPFHEKLVVASPRHDWPSLYSLCTDRIENTASIIYSIVVAGRYIAMGRLFIEPLQRNGEFLNSHVTILTIACLEMIKRKIITPSEMLRYANIS